MTLVDKVVTLHLNLIDHQIAHAFGGAIALGYYAQPRGTIEIDLNVFLAPKEARRVVRALSPLGVQGPAPTSGLQLPAAGVRCPWDETHVDLFFSYDDDFFASVEHRIEPHLFFDSADQSFVLPFLSAEDLTIFKVLFDRPKDWVDIRAMLEQRPLNLTYLEEWLLHLRGRSIWPDIRKLQLLSREYWS